MTWTTELPTEEGCAWWISWYQPTEDYRPLSVPSPEYWCTGYRCEDGAATLCALIPLAKSEEEAKSIIQKFWPEAEEWRFCESREVGYRPPADRFPTEEGE